MEVVIYVDFEHQVVLTEAEYNEKIKQKSIEYCGESIMLDRYLENENYTFSEVFGLEKEDKSRILEDFKKYCDKFVKERFADIYKKFILKV